ncbi:MAG: haloacid dehalogenase type II [Deinococcus-Thermus bacterium]|jgi:2-haloacid dehalogenase|nr:haloacid dehalogenase type II [Deinococcota bacterium]
MRIDELATTRACVFDAYGTLFDVHSAVRRHQAALGDDAGAVSALWRQKQLEYTWLRTLMDAHADFWRLTEDALDVALERFGRGEDTELRARLLAAYRELGAYPEVAGTLRSLRDHGRATAILSNGAPDMLADAVAAAGLGGLLDAVLSVEDVGVFKPRAEVYALACDRLDLPPAAICFLSANGWDAHGAAHFGFRVVWINRFDQPTDRLPGAPVATIRTLDELPPLLGDV